MFFFFNDTATTEIYTLSLHDALPILEEVDVLWHAHHAMRVVAAKVGTDQAAGDGGCVVGRDEIGRSTRLNSSHANISYAVFCLKKKTKSRWRRVRAIISSKM